MHILVVDDEQIVAGILSDQLKSEGHQVTVADSGQHAWGLLEAASLDFQMALVDRMMFGEDALTLLKKIKASEDALAALPVVIMSGEASKEERLELFKAGAFDFVFKPVETAVLLALIRRVEQG